MSVTWERGDLWTVLCFCAAGPSSSYVNVDDDGGDYLYSHVYDQFGAHPQQL